MLGPVIGVVIVIASVLCAGFAALIAQGQGQEPGWFAVAGLLLGPIGLLAAAFATPQARLSTAGADSSKMRKRAGGRRLGIPSGQRSIIPRSSRAASDERRVSAGRDGRVACRQAVPRR
jgi:hypothetical protein